MPDAIQNVPAIGYSITANLGGDRQIVFQHFVGADETDDAANAAIDRIMRMVDRQKALAELPELKAARDKFLSELSQYEVDAAEAAANFEAAQASLDVEAETLATLAKEVHDTGYAEFTASGRQGSYKPAGQTKSQIDRAKQGIEQAKAAKAKNEAEKAQALAGLAVSIKRRQDEVKILEGKIADAEKVA